MKEQRDETWEGIQISRPLREVGAKECAAWLWWRRIDVLPRSIESLRAAEKEPTTIQRLTRGGP